MEIKKNYEGLSKKYNLPSFDELNKDFEISDIEKEDFLLREIRRKIIEKIEIYTKFLEEVLQPEAIISNMYEAKLYGEEERAEIFKTYQKLMFFNRFSIETSVNETDEKSSNFIKAVFKDWQEIKDKFSNFIKKAKESWLKETDIKEELRYLG